ncbi:MAG: hypothetical protein HQL51_09860 [Magnetococcales bacterium]|nr:hypothetical protein [Magnetococcales bacterium]
MSNGKANEALSKIGVQVVQGNEAPEGVEPVRGEEEDWELNREELKRHNQAHKWGEVLRVLYYLSNKDGHPDVHKALAQAAWMALKWDAPTPEATVILYNLLVTIGPRHRAAGALSSLANLLVKLRGPRHADPELAHAQALQMLRFTSNAQGVEPDNQEAFLQWVADHQLNDPEVIIPPVFELIDALVQGDWWIDREAVQQEMEAANQQQQAAPETTH